MNFRFYLNGKLLSTVNLYEAQRMARAIQVGTLTGFNPATRAQFILLF